MIKASLIVPTYKRPEETAKCLGLVAQSKYLKERFDLEIVVIDSSPDKKTWDAIKKFESDFDLKYIYLKKQTLPGKARNFGIKKAKNELIISIDSDIEVKEDTIWSMIQYLKNNPRVAKMTGTSIFSSGAKKGEIDRPTKWDRTYEKYDTLFIEGIYGRYEAFYKTPFLKIGGYDEIFGFCGEGTDISIRYWRAGFPLGFSKETTAYHNSEAAESLRRMIPDKMTQMYRSLFLVAYKYDVKDSEVSKNFVKSHEERQGAYGLETEFHALVSAAQSIDWLKENYQRVKLSKSRAPREYDFKPFDVFTDIKLLESCLGQSKNEIEPFYNRVFLK